jgi:Arc/MetJ-type ribon-helix-helix transcriptional regulator
LDPAPIRGQLLPRSPTARAPVPDEEAIGTATEVIREALRLFEAYHAVQQSSLAALKADIDQGMVDVQAGRVSKLNMTAIKAQARASKKRA